MTPTTGLTLARPSRWRWLGLLLPALLTAFGSAAQTPTVTAVSPARNAASAATTSPVSLSFSQAIDAATAGNLRVHSSQRGGQLVRAGGGTVSGGGTTQVQFAPAQPWQPGEVLSVSVPATVQSTGGVAARPHVHQFTAAATGGSAVFVSGYGSDLSTAGATNPTGVATGDLDNDGDLDVVNGLRNLNQLRVSLNSGNGTFPSTLFVATGTAPNAVALADLDNDGDLDIVVSTGTSTLTAGLAVHYNNGAGQFPTTTSLTLPKLVNDLALGDVDGDGDLDILTANISNSTTSNDSNILLVNNGSGSLALSYNVLGLNITNLNDVSLADLDNDGDLDALAAASTASRCYIRLNDGTGVFSGTASLATGGSSIAVGDADGDNDLDVLTSGNGPILFINNGGLSFTRTQPSISMPILVPTGTGTTSYTSVPQDATLADIDGDGDLDLLALISITATLSGGGTSTRPGELRIFANNGSGSFSALTSCSVGRGPQVLTVGDLDGDGDLDALGTSSGNESTNLITVDVRLNGATATSLSTDPLIDSYYCRGRAVSVSFQTVGSFDFSNVFTAQLSDASGSFALPVEIGTLRSETPGTINATIPSGTAPGTGYRIRVVSSLLPLTGTDNGSDITIYELSANTIAATTTPNPVAAGGTISLDVTGPGTSLPGVTYGWTGPNSFTSTLRNPTVASVTTAGDGIYRVVVAAGGCTYASPVDVTVMPPSITTGDPTGGATQFCAGSSISVPFATSGPFAAGTTFSLYLVDVSGQTFIISNGSSALLNGGTITGTIPSTFRNSTTLRAQVRSNVALSSYTSSPTDLTVTNLNLTNPALSVVANTPVAEGADLNLDVANVPLSGATFAWAGPNGFTASTQSPTVPAVTTAAAGSYSVTVSLNGCSRTLSRSVTVTPTPRSITVSALASNILCAGGTFSLPFSKTGSFNAANVFTAQLSNAAGVFSGVTTLGTLAGSAAGTINATLPAGLASGTAYRLRVVASSPATTGTTSSFAVTVVNLSAVTVGSNSPLEEGQTLSLTAAGAPAGVTYDWTGPNNFTSTDQNPTLPAATLAAAGTYSLTVSQGSCSMTRTVSVVVNVAPLEVTAVSPTRNLRNAATSSAVGITFSQAVSAASAGNVQVHSSRRGGQLVRAGGGTLSGSGTAQVDFAPVQPWLPGETVRVSVPATVQSVDGVRSARPHVFQFTTAAGGAGGGVFGGGSDVLLPTGHNADHLTLADVNGDGYLDFLTANVNGNNASVRLNDGAGNFNSGSTVPAGVFPSDITTADVDNDGDLDMLVLNQVPNSLSVRFNDGTGTFSGTTNQSLAGSDAMTMAVGDVDGDGDLDLAVAHRTDNMVRVYANNGSGVFSNTGALSFGANPQDVALGDLDGDGDLDLITGLLSNVATVSVRFNNGQGTFSGTGGVNVPNGILALQLGDVDGDNDLDVVTAGYNIGNATVCFNNGTGGLTVGPGVPMGTGTESLVLGDVDGDGDLDLLVPSSAGGSASTVAVAVNDGAGAFSLVRTFAIAGPNRGRVALGDVDGDGDLDFLAPNHTNSVSVRFNGGTTLPPVITSFTPTSGAAGTIATLTGTNLLNITGATFNGTPVTLTNITSNTSTSVTLVAPSSGSTGPISVTTAGGTGTSSQIFIYLVPTTLSVGRLGAGSYCAGAAISVPFTAAGSYAAGNVFTAQLSDANGAFGPGITNMGTLTGTASGTIAGTIPAAIAGSSLYRVRVVASSPATTSANSQPLSITAAGTVAWLGGVSTDWFTNGNWSCGQVPTATDNVSVNSGATYYPVVTGGTATASNLTVAAGASFAIASTLNVRGNLTIDGSWTAGGSLVFVGGTGTPNLISGAAPVALGNVNISTGTTVQLGKSVAVTGNWTNNGSFNPAGYGVTLQGTTAQTLGGSQPTRFYDLTVQNPAGASCASATGITHILTLATGNLAASNQLTLHSNATGTAMVINPAGGGVVTGRATMERFITGSTTPGYRHYASPMQAGTATVQEFADDLPSLVLNPAYNTLGNSATPFPTFFEYAEGRLTTALPSFDQGWQVPAATTNLVPLRGYSVQTNPTTTVDVSGELNNGPVNIALTRGSQSNSGWNLLGNPYPAPIDWDLVPATAGLDKALYVFAPSGRYTGAYRSYVNGVGQNGGSKDLAAMQGFFVRATAPAATLSLTNAVRHTSFASPIFGRSTATAGPVLRLEARNAQGQADETVLYGDPNAAAGYASSFDAYKVQLNGSGRPSLWSQAGNDYMAINGLPDLTTAGVVPLGLRVSQPGAHTLVLTAWHNAPAGTQVWLEDRHLGRRQDLTTDSTYAFTAHPDSLRPRFFLWFQGRPTGTTGAAAGLAISLYPNPTATGHATLTVSNLREQAAVKTEVLNAIGQVVQQQRLPVRRGALQVDLLLENLPAGVYSVRLHTAEGPVVRRLVKE